MKQILPTLFAWLLFTPVWAQQAPAPAAKTYLHANRIRMGEIVPGGLQWKKIIQPFSSIPDTFNAPVIANYNGAPKPVAGIERMGLWLGALDSTGSPRVSCFTGYNHQPPFVAGPLSGVWPADSLGTSIGIAFSRFPEPK